MSFRPLTPIEEIMLAPPERLDQPTTRIIAGERHEWVTNANDGGGMWYFWRRLSTQQPRAMRASSSNTSTVDRARPRERRSTRRAATKSRGPDDSPGDRPPDGSPPSVGRVAGSGRRVTYRDVTYRLNVAQEWHAYGADDDAWDVINSLREEIDRDLRDEARAAA